jgi:hypothetical protein
MVTQRLVTKLRTLWSDEITYPTDEQTSAPCLWARVKNTYNTLIHTNSRPTFSRLV